MKIENLKELQRVIKLCRSLGVDSIKIDNVEMHLGAVPYKYTNKSNNTAKSIQESLVIVPGGITEDTRIDTDSLTEEQILFWSSVPESTSNQQ